MLASIGEFIESFDNPARRHSRLGDIEFEIKVQSAGLRHSQTVREARGTIPGSASTASGYFYPLALAEDDAACFSISARAGSDGAFSAPHLIAKPAPSRSEFHACRCVIHGEEQPEQISDVLHNIEEVIS